MYKCICMYLCLMYERVRHFIILQEQILAPLGTHGFTWRDADCLREKMTDTSP